MTPISALVVGIERYAQRGWDVAGPGRSAVEVVEWLLTRNAPLRKISLFVNFKGRTQSEEERLVEPLIANGVTVSLTPDWHAIDTCISNLAQDASPKSRLFLYWAGHGYTDPSGRRLFFCQDYTAHAMRSRVFNATNWLRQLRSSRFHSFSDQIVIADTCGSFDRLLSAPGEEAPPDQREDIRQIAFFASPDGRTARVDENGNVFTRIFLNAVASGQDWPDHAGLFHSMKESLERNGTQAFRIWASSETDSIPDRVLGGHQAPAARHPGEIYRSEEELSRYPLTPFHPTDNQKGRWGGRSSADGRRLQATVVKNRKEDYDVTLQVTSTDGSRLQGSVRFHLHDTYKPQVVNIRRCNPDAKKELQAYEEFTVGVQVPRVDGKLTVLELDLEKAFKKADRIYKRSKE